MNENHSIFKRTIIGKEVTMQLLFSLILFGLVFVAGLVPVFADGGNRPAERKNSYDPVILYPGPYMPEQLFYRNPKGQVWLRWTTADFSRKVTCPGALKRLKRRGVWKGHLKPGGSCGSPAEPSDWAVGNWINYYLSSSPDNRQ